MGVEEEHQGVKMHTEESLSHIHGQTDPWIGRSGRTQSRSGIKNKQRKMGNPVRQTLKRTGMNKTEVSHTFNFKTWVSEARGSQV
jgi:hypothetical protein